MPTFVVTGDATVCRHVVPPMTTKFVLQLGFQCTIIYQVERVKRRCLDAQFPANC